MIFVLILILVNTAVSLLGFRAFREGKSDNFLFIPSEVIKGKNIRGMIISNFAHSSWGHLLFNMISFFFFAPVIARMGGSIGLILIYAVSGIGADLLTLLIHSKNLSYRALGASGSITGIIFASIVFDPSINVMFFFVPIPIPGPVFAVGYILISFYLMKQEGGTVSHEAHIGGAVVGFIMAVLLAPEGAGPLFKRITEMFS